MDGVPSPWKLHMQPSEEEVRYKIHVATGRFETQPFRDSNVDNLLTSSTDARPECPANLISAAASAVFLQTVQNTAVVALLLYDAVRCCMQPFTFT